MKEEKKDL